MKKSFIGLAILAVVTFISSQFLTIFVVPPIGALPEGRTIVIPRMDQMSFIESPDGMCLRVQDGVSLLCRGLMLGSLNLTETPILVRLPYSEFLYLMTTDGQKFDR